MINEEIIIQEQELTKIEARAIDSYIEDIYSKKVPEPTSPNKNDLSFWRIAGIEATLFTIAGIAIAIYSAIRTGGLFYIMESLLLREFGLPEALINTFSLSAMITSLGAFELYVLADGFSKGRENKNLKRSEIGLYASLGVIVLAGIFTGLGLVPQLSDTFKVIFYSIIAVTTAISGGLVALYSGQNIGYTVLRVEKAREKMLKMHSENYQKWKEGAVKSYQTSRYALGSKKSNNFIESLNNIKKQKTKAFETEVTEEPTPPLKAVIVEKQVPAKKIEPKKTQTAPVAIPVKGEYTKHTSPMSVFDNIHLFVKANNRLPRNTELDLLSADKDMAMAELAKYMVTYEDKILEYKMTTAESIEKAREYLRDHQE
jgi:hypothetical protein